MIPQIAKREGAFLIEINPEVTELTYMFDVSIRVIACQIVPKLMGDK